MDVSPSKDLFRLKRRAGVSPNDADIDCSGLEFDEPVEEIYHLTLNHFYPSQSVSLLRRSMGLPVDETLYFPKELRNLQPFVLNFNRQDQVTQAGSLRNYIIMGSRPTNPYTVITVLRQPPNNPFDLWQYELPQPPFPTAPASVLHWDADTEAQLLIPRLPTTLKLSPTSSRAVIDLDMMRVYIAWDIQRDELVQAVIWCNASGIENRVFELRYGDKIGSLEMLKDLEAFICFCGCGMLAKNNIHVKLSLKSGILFWFPYEQRSIPKDDKHFRYIKNEIKGSMPFVYLDLSARTKTEMERHMKDTPVEIRVINLCLLDRPQPLRFKNPGDHAEWYSTIDAFFLFAEWSTRKIFHIVYRIDALAMTCRSVRISRLQDEDRKRLALKHTHDCAKMSAELPIKHYPRWSCSDQSLAQIFLDELDLELKLDFLPSRDGSDLDIDRESVINVSNLMQNSSL
ncbi:hypothetical protein H072_2841 [Dactylellina haptotyla CBS 200.50]|uniref:Uncharacterized protein n=1 Tax=Dactylellina haptotyla (strain CBS 200.50) TaxID=1284197 RepID=S8BUN6_DACHA|nr:hypothetical protein H072_2841 [Dactylellina haptotyla CBS 200.50]